jgi:hypothetical protein
METTFAFDMWQPLACLLKREKLFRLWVNHLFDAR